MISELFLLVRLTVQKKLRDFRLVAIHYVMLTRQALHISTIFLEQIAALESCWTIFVQLGERTISVKPIENKPVQTLTARPFFCDLVRLRYASCPSAILCALIHTRVDILASQTDH